MILTLMILFGVIVGGVALFGAGGWVRRREIEDKLDDDGEDRRPEHTVVENETRDKVFPRRTTARTQPPE